MKVEKSYSQGNYQNSPGKETHLSGIKKKFFQDGKTLKLPLQFLTTTQLPNKNLGKKSLLYVGPIYMYKNLCRVWFFGVGTLINTTFFLFSYFNFLLINVPTP